MKKQYFVATILGVFFVAASTFTYRALADAQGGNTAATFSGNGATLNTAVQLSAADRATLRTNLGVDSDDRSQTNTLTFSGTGGVIIGGTGTGFVLGGTPASPVTGNLVLTATSVKVYLTGSTGLVIKSGTVTTF